MSDPITRNGSGYSAPRDSNRVPITFGVSTVDGITPVPIEVNPSTGQLQTSGSGGGGGGTQYQELATTTPATGNLILGRYQTSLPTLTNGQLNEPMLDATSTLLVNSSTLATAANQTTMNSNLTSIVTNTAAGATSANQTNGTQQSKITDGTNIANIVAGDTGFNSLLVGSGIKSFTGLSASSLNGDVFTSTDVSAYKTIYFSLEGTFSATVTFQVSNDNSTWRSTVATPSIGSANTSSTTNAGNTYISTIVARYFRIRITAYVSGTVTGTVYLSTLPSSLSSTTSSQNGTWTVGSNSANGSTVPANAFYIAANQTGTGNLIGAMITTTVDGLANQNSLVIRNFNQLYNGTTNDSMRSATAVSNTTGTGLLGVGTLAYDGTNYQRTRINTSVVVVAAGQTSTTTQTITTFNARSLVLAVNITAGVGTLTVAINGTTTSGYTYPILTSTALTGIADNTLRVFPGATPATNTVANDVLPPTISVTYTVASSVTFGSDAVLSV